MADVYEVKPTEKQVMAVNAVLEGETNLGQAMRTAGYSETSSLNPRQNFVDSRGVQAYLQTLDEKSQMRFKMNALEKVMEVYLDAMSAHKYFPVKTNRDGNLVKVPDHIVRMQAADRIVKLTHAALQSMKQNEITPIPDLNDPEVKDFNMKFKKFLEDYAY